MSKDIQTQRRSSIKNLQVPGELLNIVPQEVFKNCPELQNIGRLSGNTTRNSWNIRTTGSGAGRAGTSGIPTPTCPSTGRGVRARPGDRGGRGGLTVANRTKSAISLGPPGSAGPSSTSRGRGSASRATTSTTRGRGAFSMQPLSRATSTCTLSSTLNSTRRKSKSYDSLSLLQTPAFTPGLRNRSKSPGSTTHRRGLVNDASNQGKNIKISKEKSVQVEMAKYIFAFLDAQGCQSNTGQWKDFIMNPPQLSVSQYMSMIKFLGSHFVGESFFGKANAKQERGAAVDDALDKVLEVSKVLKYPGSITKSHLKSANSQHAWPSCLTFLAWLCCRTNCLVNPPQERTGIDELANNGMQEYAFESYLNLFPAHFNRTLTQEAVDEELVNFKMRVQEAQGVEQTKTKEELIKERDEKSAELDELKNAADPSKELKERHAQEVQLQSTLQEKIKDTEIKCKNFSNTNHLVLHLERLEQDINARLAEISKLKKQVESQPLSKEDALVVLNETEMLKDQLASIVRVNEQLKSEYENRNKKVDKFRKDLYELCTTFSIVERYNEIVRFLRMDDLVICPNPFSTKELEEWMKDASKTLRRADAKVKEMVHQVDKSSDQKSKETREYQQQVENLQKQVSDLQDKLQSAESYNKFLSAEFEKTYSMDLETLHEVTAALHAEEGVLKEALQNKEVFVKSHQEWSEVLEGYRKGEAEWKLKLKNELEKFAVENAKANQFIATSIEDAARRQQEFFQQHFGVDIFADSDDDELNTTG